MPNAYHWVTKGALSPAMPFAITQGGSAYNLTGKTVTCTYRPAGSVTPTVTDGACTKNSPDTAGTGYYPFQTGDTDTAGEYLVKWKVSDGLVLPADGFDHLIVTET